MLLFIKLYVSVLHYLDCINNGSLVKLLCTKGKTKQQHAEIKIGLHEHVKQILITL